MGPWFLIKIFITLPKGKAYFSMFFFLSFSFDTEFQNIKITALGLRL